IATFEVNRPCPCERSQSRFSRSIDSESRKAFDGYHRTGDDDCTSGGHQRQRLLHCEESPLDVNAEILVEMSFGDLFERSECPAAGIRKENIKPTLLSFDRGKQLVEICKTRYIATHASDAIPNLFHGSIEFGLPTTRDE